MSMLVWKASVREYQDQRGNYEAFRIIINTWKARGLPLMEDGCGISWVWGAPHCLPESMEGKDNSRFSPFPWRSSLTLYRKCTCKRRQSGAENFNASVVCSKSGTVNDWLMIIVETKTQDKLARQICITWNLYVTKLLTIDFCRCCKFRCFKSTALTFLFAYFLIRLKSIYSS